MSNHCFPLVNYVNSILFVHIQDGFLFKKHVSVDFSIADLDAGQFEEEDDARVQILPPPTRFEPRFPL